MSEIKEEEEEKKSRLTQTGLYSLNSISWDRLIFLSTERRCFPGSKPQSECACMFVLRFSTFEYPPR